MNKRLSLLLLVFVLAACAPVGAPSPTAIPTANTTPPTATPLGYPAPPTPYFPTPPPAYYPAPGTPIPGTPFPTSTPVSYPPPATAFPTAGPEGAPAFSDCALLPVLPSCGAKLPLAGILAFYDAKGSRMVVANFDRGTAWQAPALSGLPPLSFSPSGKLLAIPGVPETFYDSASGKQVDQAAAQADGGWNLQEKPAPGPDTVYSAAGDAAWIDYATALVHVRFAADPSKDVTWPVAPGPSDQIQQIVTWVPGSSLLLFEAHYGSNSMWILGGALSTLDVKTGAVKPMGANMLLDFQFAWNPKEPGVLAFGDSSNPPGPGVQQLAVLDTHSGKLTHLVADPNVSSLSESWLPDGKSILFAAAWLPYNTVDASNPFALPAIYLVNADGSGLKRLTTPAASERDSWATPLADGTRFLYFRIDAQTGTLSVRLGSLDGSLDAPVTGALAAPQCGPVPPCDWSSTAVYQP